MATYYWVGGNGIWDSTTTTNWATTTGGAGGAGVPTLTDTVNFDANSGTAATVTITSTAVCTSCTVNKSDINLSLSGSPTFSSTSTFTLTAGTLTLNSFSITINTFSSNNLNARTLAFGTGQINITGNNGTPWQVSNTTGLVVSGTPTVNFTYSGSTGIRTIANGNASGYTSGTEVTVNINAGTDTVQMQGYFKNINFTGFSGIFSLGANVFLYGNLTISSGMTLTATTSTLSFFGTSGTYTITTNGKAFDCPITFNGVGGTWQLQDALTTGSSRTVTLTNGSLDLNNNNLTCGSFSSNNSNTRSILFGTGQIYLSWGTGGSATVWNFATATGYTCTGSNVINLTSNNKTLTRAINYGGNSGGGGVEAYAPNVNVTAGSDTIQLSAVAAGTVKDLNFTGFSGNVIYNSIGIVGNITLSPTMTISISSAPWQLSCTAAGTKTIKTNGVSMPGLYIGSNATTTVFQLLDNLTIGGGYNLTHINGTLDLNGYTLTCNNWASNYSNTRRIAFGNGTVIITGSGATTWNCGATNLTTTGTGTIKMISSSAKTFAGGGANYAATLDHGGTGDLTISGSNTFANITSSISGTAAVNIFFTAGTTTTLSNFTASGTSGNILTLSSTTTSNFTLSKASSNVIINYVSISYSTATGGASWNAAAGNSTNGTNNSGWNFIGLVMRLNSSGNLFINGILDEVTNAGSGVPARTNTSNLYANTFDEVTINSIGGGLARKIFNDGTYQISGIFDEVTGAV